MSDQIEKAINIFMIIAKAKSIAGGRVCWELRKPGVREAWTGGGEVGPRGPRGGRGLDREVGPMRTTTPRLPRAASPWPREPRGGGAVAAAI